MSHDPKPTRADLATWRELIRLAGHHARNVRAAPTLLGQTAKRAKLAVVPIGPLCRDNAFVRLQRKATAFAGETVFGRNQLAGELGEVAACCGALLDPTSPDEPASAAVGARLPYRDE